MGKQKLDKGKKHSEIRSACEVPLHEDEDWMPRRNTMLDDDEGRVQVVLSSPPARILVRRDMMGSMQPDGCPRSVC
jgi:hypothetical protein